MLGNVRHVCVNEGSWILVFVRSLKSLLDLPIAITEILTSLLTGHLGNILRDILLAAHEQ